MLMVLQRKFVTHGHQRALAATAGAILLIALLTSYFYGSVFDADYILGCRTLVSGKEPARKPYGEALACGRYQEVASKSIFILWKRINGREALK